MNIKSRRDESYFFAITVAVVMLSLVVAEGAEVFDNYLYADDGYWVAMPMRGYPQTVQNYQLFHDAIFWISYFQSVPLLRISLILAHAASAGILYLIFRQASVDRMPAVAASVFSATLPIFALQHLFISASHMVAGLPVFLLGVLAISKLSADQGRKNWLYTVASLLFLGVAARVSPLYSLAPLVAPVGLITGRASKSLLRNALAFTLVLGLSGGELYMRLRYQPHVYAKAQGWSDVSFSHVIANVREAMDIVTQRMLDQNSIASAFFLLGVLAVSAAIWLGVAKGWRSWRGWARLCSFSGTGMLLLAASALVFGPASVVSVFQDRYGMVPAMLGVAAVACFLRPLLNADQSKRKWAIVSGLGLMILSNLIGLRSVQHAAASGLGTAHAWLEQAILEDRADWKSQPQIVVLLPETGRSPAGAFPHFSTGYTRLLAGRDDLYALVGKASEADAWPFVDKQNLFGSGAGYWVARQGKVARTHMAGLRKDRPLYVYAPDKEGRPRLLERVVFVSSDGLLTAEAGQPVAVAPGEGAKALCAEVATGKSALWPYFQEVRSKQNNKMGAETAVFFDTARGGAGAEKHWSLSIPSGSRVEIDFTIEGARSVATDATPADAPEPGRDSPMPLSAPFLAVYQVTGGFWIEDRISGRLHRSDSPGGKTSIELSGYEGCGFSLTVDNVPKGILGSHQISGDWLWGRGVGQSYWHGKVLDLNIRRDGVPISP